MEIYIQNGNIYPSTYSISEKYSNKFNIKEKKSYQKIYFEAFENADIPKQCENCTIKDKCKKLQGI